MIPFPQVVVIVAADPIMNSDTQYTDREALNLKCDAWILKWERRTRTGNP